MLNACAGQASGAGAHTHSPVRSTSSVEVPVRTPAKTAWRVVPRMETPAGRRTVGSRLDRTLHGVMGVPARSRTSSVPAWMVTAAAGAVSRTCGGAGLGEGGGGVATALPDAGVGPPGMVLCAARAAVRADE